VVRLPLVAPLLDNTFELSRVEHVQCPHRPLEEALFFLKKVNTLKMYIERALAVPEVVGGWSCNEEKEHPGTKDEAQQRASHLLLLLRRHL
jgi:hypothetical protein